jgi:superfamily II DNA or RNA helicase
MIEILEKPWFIELNLTKAQALQTLGLDQEGNPALLYGTDAIIKKIKETQLYKSLAELANYQIKAFSMHPRRNNEENETNNQKEYDPVTVYTINAAKLNLNDEAHAILALPKAKLSKAEKVLKRLGEPFTTHRSQHPKPNLRKLLTPFPNPNITPGSPEFTTLEELQRDIAFEAFTKGKSGTLHYAMGGGKTVLIAAALRIFPQLRPAIITSAASADSQQLAAKIARITKEPTYLAGCASGALTTKEKKELFCKLPEASIIVGSHKIYDKEGPTEGKAAQLAQKIKEAKLILIDEIHECATPHKVRGISKTTPEAVFGFTATWRMNWSGNDNILADMLNCEAETLCSATHAQVQESGRVTPVEIIGYTFHRPHYPTPDHAYGHFQGFTFFQQNVEYNASRNNYLAKLCNHLMEVNEQEKRGCILAFSTSIKHCQRVVQELCRIRRIPWSDTALQDESIYIVNGQLTNTQKTIRMKSMAEGRTKIVLATEVLSRGIDMPTIYDVIDLTASAKTVQLIQKSGRSVRPEDQKIARIHCIVEEDLPHETGKNKAILRYISQSKLNNLKNYFNSQPNIIPANRIPWGPHAPTSPTSNQTLPKQLA